jgi:hypothetical protein
VKFKFLALWCWLLGPHRVKEPDEFYSYCSRCFACRCPVCVLNELPK